MLKVHNPRSIAAPIGTYSHGIEVPPAARWLYVAGQIGVRPDGSVPSTIEEQTEVVWQNILAVLADAGMGIGDVVKIITEVSNSSGVRTVAPRTITIQTPV